MWKLPTSIQLCATWHTDSLDMVVLPSTSILPYHDCCRLWNQSRIFWIHPHMSPPSSPSTRNSPGFSLSNLKTSQLSHNFIKFWNLLFSEWCEVTILLGYDTVSLGNWFLTFLDSTAVSSSCVSQLCHVQHGWYRLIKTHYSHLNLNIIHILTLQTMYAQALHKNSHMTFCSLTLYIQ
jgi:hypothetical protein